MINDNVVNELLENGIQPSPALNARVAHYKWCEHHGKRTVYDTVNRAAEAGKGYAHYFEFLAPGIIADLNERGFGVEDHGNDDHPCYRIRWAK